MIKTKKVTKRDSFLSEFIKEYQATTEVFGNYTIIHYKKNNQFCLASLTKKSKKFILNYTFSTYEKYYKFYNDYKLNIIKINEKEQALLDKMKEEAEEIQEGKILVSIWGYEQTNVNFYEVVKRKGNLISLQEIEKEKTFTSPDCGTCLPNKNFKIGSIFNRKINKFSSVNINEIQKANLYKGNKIYWSSYS